MSRTAATLPRSADRQARLLIPTFRLPGTVVSNYSRAKIRNNRESESSLARKMSCEMLDGTIVEKDTYHSQKVTD
jgi:hypothetical protein